NIFAENQQLFASSRAIRVLGDSSSIYGLDPEDAWNYGASYIQGFNLFGRTANITLDYYVTNFRNQVVVDWENPLEVSFYNLEGKSMAKSFQFEINYNALKNFELRTAYKFYDVETDYQSGTLQKPLQAQHRFFANLGYMTVPKENGAQWRMDYTVHTLGRQRLPNTANNSMEYSPSYSLMNAQITKVFNNNFEIYVGGENLTNFMQDNPVVGAEDPFGTNFDTTMVYAPIMGRMFYAGFRYKL
ncbi:MAG: TonB-dependent receptor, partial [Arenibacter sp.]